MIDRNELLDLCLMASRLAERSWPAAAPRPCITFRFETRDAMKEAATDFAEAFKNDVAFGCSRGLGGETSLDFWLCDVPVRLTCK